MAVQWLCVPVTIGLRLISWDCCCMCWRRRVWLVKDKLFNGGVSKTDQSLRFVAPPTVVAYRDEPACSRRTAWSYQGFWPSSTMG